MKTKLLIILFLGLTVTGFGQGNGIGIGYAIPDSNIVKINSSQGAEFVIDEQLLKAATANGILPLWDVYKTDCYNDSTHKSVHRDGHQGFCWSYDGEKCNNETHYKLVWVHKNTSFEGFMEWIEKKYKTKN